MLHKKKVKVTHESEREKRYDLDDGLQKLHNLHMERDQQAKTYHEQQVKAKN